MSHARRRLVPLLFALLTAFVLAFAATSTPALATESSEDHAEEEESGFGSGQWDGMLLAALGGVLFGAVVFGSSDPGGIPKADAHH